MRGMQGVWSSARGLVSLGWWTLRGKPIPPPRLVKHRILRKYAAENELSVLVETGTFDGDTVDAMSRYFERIDSVELAEDLYDRARRRFEDRKHIRIWHGDSGAVMQELLPSITRPCLFWLDAHYSGGDTAQGDEWSPVIKEVRLIANHKVRPLVVLIDDARGFTGNGSPTIQQIIDAAGKGIRRYAIADDIIRLEF